MNIFLRVTAPLAAMNFLNQASRAVLAVIGPALALEFALSASDLGLLAAVMFMAYAATQLPAGLALDLFGARRVQATLALTAGSGFLLCALAEGIGTVMLGRLLTGIGIAAGLTAMLKANTQWYPRHRVAAMTGTALLIGAMGGMSVTLPLSTLLPLIGWRGGFALLAGLSLVVALWIWLSVPDAPPGQARPAGRSLVAEAQAFGPIFRHPAFIGLVPAVCVLSAMNFTYQGLWAGPWLRDVAGLGADARAVVLFAYAGCMAVGSFTTGQLASWGQARGAPPMLVPFLAMGVQISLQAVFALAAPTGLVALCLLWGLFAMAGSAGPAAYAAIGQRFPAELAGRVATAINAAMLCLVFILQSLIGAVLDLWPRTATGGWDPAGYSWALACTIALHLLALLWAWRAARRVRASAP
ncbi:MFS transporter [Sabulicella rubraurantiaca]|uniref:MFS transporter n=1 Tax=Sabulicella rubraurantiaca TaxID=2811429 RepID=UPI001A97607B|nr:MFS transporter [Sabulicella rubraurantiaca]